MIAGPDRMDRDDLASLAGEAKWVTAVHARSTVASTLDLAREGALAGAPAGSVWVAEEQAGGRGRQGNHPDFAA